MRPLRVIFIMVLTLVFCSTLTGQQAPQKDAQAVAILEKSFLAMSGSSGATFRDLTLSGNVAVERPTGQATGTFRFKLAGKDKQRVDFFLDSVSVSHVVNGTRGLQIRGGQSKRLPYHVVLGKRPDFIPLLCGPSDASDPNLQIVFVGEESLDGRLAYHIRVEKVFPNRPADRAQKLRELSSVDLHIDASTFLVLKLSRKIPSLANLNNTLLEEYRYSDYRSVGGILLPHSISTYLRGQKTSDMVVTSASLNAGVNPSDFEVR